jgi:hypothetical protein
VIFKNRSISTSPETGSKMLGLYWLVIHQLPRGEQPGSGSVNRQKMTKRRVPAPDQSGLKITLGRDLNSGMLGANASHGRRPSH